MEFYSKTKATNQLQSTDYYDFLVLASMLVAIIHRGRKCSQEMRDCIYINFKSFFVNLIISIFCTEAEAFLQFSNVKFVMLLHTLYMFCMWIIQFIKVIIPFYHITIWPHHRNGWHFRVKNNILLNFKRIFAESSRGKVTYRKKLQEKIQI